MLTNEAALNSAEPANVHTTSREGNSLPIAPAAPRRNSVTFKRAELLNKVVTFRPANIAADDFTINTGMEAYMPEFELAA
jgi:hypothetical protein